MILELYLLLVSPARLEEISDNAREELAFWTSKTIS